MSEQPKNTIVWRWEDVNRAKQFDVLHDKFQRYPHKYERALAGCDDLFDRAKSVIIPYLRAKKGLTGLAGSQNLEARLVVGSKIYDLKSSGETWNANDLSRHDVDLLAKELTRVFPERFQEVGEKDPWFHDAVIYCEVEDGMLKLDLVGKMVMPDGNSREYWPNTCTIYVDDAEFNSPRYAPKTEQGEAEIEQAADIASSKATKCPIGDSVTESADRTGADLQTLYPESATEPGSCNTGTLGV